jgi:DNA polymerase
MASQFTLFDQHLEPPIRASVCAAEPGTRDTGGDPPPPPAPEGAAELTGDEKEARLAELRIPALACERCGLSGTRTNVVFGEGNPAAPLVFIGEGPGENEDATGRPFVGRAGKLLDGVLRRNGMTREHVYICNVLKCRAAGMENGRWLNRPPTVEEIDACRPWLQQQLGIIKPLVVVCLGAPAANTVIHKGFRMTAERGRWFTTSPYAPWAMAAFHPAYVLRLHGPGYDAALDTLVQDIASARQKVIEVKRQLKERAAAAPPPRTLFD